MPDDWAPLDAALDRAGQDGRLVEIWLRDDDAVTPTPALDRLAAFAEAQACPVLLAVIPHSADSALARFVAATPLFTPTQHGYAHVNHAPPPQRASEFGEERNIQAAWNDLARGRDTLQDLFGSACADMLVPPWNRIAPAVVAGLPALGFGALSTFAEAHAEAENLDILNATLDIIDWRHGQVVHGDGKLATRLAALVDEGRPIGLLTHHLVHDAAAWSALDRLFEHLQAAAPVRLRSAAELRSRASVHR